MLQGHERSITQIKYNREGDLLFSSSKDYRPNVWFTVNGERLGTYNGHQGAVWCMDVDWTSTKFLSGGGDMTLKYVGPSSIWSSQLIVVFLLDFGVSRLERALRASQPTLRCVAVTSASPATRLPIPPIKLWDTIASSSSWTHVRWTATPLQSCDCQWPTRKSAHSCGLWMTLSSPDTKMASSHRTTWE